MFFRAVLLFFLLAVCIGCSGLSALRHEPAPDKPIVLTFDATVIDNKDGIEIFYCRPLFEKGTWRGHPASGLTDKARKHRPAAMTGKLKDRDGLQRELILCGLFKAPLFEGMVSIPPMRDITLNFPLLDMRKPVNIRYDENGFLHFTGMPTGLPDGLETRLSPGESLVIAWFDKNRQLTIARWTRAGTSESPEVSTASEE